MTRTLLLSIFSVLAILSCTPEIDEPASVRGNLPVGGLMVVGDSYAAGVTSGTWSEFALENSPAKGLEEAFRKIGMTASFNSPAFAEGFDFGFENGMFTAAYRLENWVDCRNDSITFPRRDEFNDYPVNWFIPGESVPPLQNFAVPGLEPAYLNIPLNFNLLPFKPFLQRMAQDTVVNINSIAVQNAPEFVFIWLGTEMIFEHLMAANSHDLPSPTAFANEIETLLDSISESMKGGVIASIPAIFDFPFFQLAMWDNLEINEEEAALLNSVYGSPDYIYKAGRNPFTLENESGDSVRRAEPTDLIFFNTPLEKVKCELLASLFPLGKNYFADINTQQFVKSRINAYNFELARIAAERNLAFADMNMFFKNIQTGYREKGIDFSFDYITGQFFSLDARHPTPRGYGLVINELLKVISQKYQAKLPGVNVANRKAVRFP